MRNTTQLSCLLVVTTMLAPAPLWAARPQPNGAHLEQTQLPTVEVVSSNGESYTAVAGNAAPVSTLLYGRCTNGQKLKGATVKADGWPGPASEAYLDALPHHAIEMPPTAVSVPDGIHPQGVAYPQAWRQRAVMACNNHLNQQMNVHGMERQAILAKNWELKNVPLDTLHGALRCDPDEDAPFGAINKYYKTSIDAKMNVRCARYMIDKLKANPEPPPTSTGDFKLKVGVSQATLMMLPNNYTGHCPAEINASGTIVTNGKTAVKYRLESDKGELSPVYVLQVDQTHTAFFNTKFKIGKFKTGGAGASFTAAEGPPSGGQGLKEQAVPASPGVYQGFYRLHIIAPNPLVSAPAAYKVTCTVSTPGSFSQQPSAPAGSPPPTPAKPPVMRR